MFGYLYNNSIFAGRGTTALKSKNDQTHHNKYFIVGKYQRGWPIGIIRRYNVYIRLYKN